LEAIIGSAKQNLHLQFYAFEADATGNWIAGCIREAARRGVEVYLLLDAYGSKDLPPGFTKNLSAAGVHVRFFSPVLSLKGFFIGRRLHHKVVVADGQQALIGGVNVSDRYHGTNETPAWLDFAVRMEGEICRQAQNLCEELWKHQPFVVNLNRRFRSTGILEKPLVTVVHNDWLRRRTALATNYRLSIQRAKHSIILVASYFLPGRNLRLALARAARRGVSVKLILSGDTDVWWMKYAAMHLYRYFLKSKIELYEWRLSVLHGKAMLIDDEWCTIGSFNLNYLSIYGSLETNVEIREPLFLETFRTTLETVLQGCEKIEASDFELKTTRWTRFRNLLIYRLMRRALMMMTYFSYRRWGVINER
jgi:cardiolipin synthase